MKEKDSPKTYSKLREFCTHGVGFEGVTEEMCHRVIKNLGVRVKKLMYAMVVTQYAEHYLHDYRQNMIFNYLYFNQNKGFIINKKIGSFRAPLGTNWERMLQCNAVKMLRCHYGIYGFSKLQLLYITFLHFRMIAV